MKSILFSIFITIAACSYAQNRSENTSTITRNIPTFQAIKSEGPFYITVTNATQNGKINLKGIQRQLDRIITEVNSEGVLVIKFKPLQKVKGTKRKTKTVNKNYKSNLIHITVNAQNLNSVQLSGSGKINLEGTQNVDTFTASVSGSGDINANVKANKTSITVSGSGDVEISGKTQQLNAQLSGSGDIEAEKLQAINAKVNLVGSGDIKVWVTDDLNGKITGSGDIHYRDSPKNLVVKTVGSGDFKRLD